MKRLIAIALLCAGLCQAADRQVLIVVPLPVAAADRTKIKAALAKVAATGAVLAPVVWVHTASDKRFLVDCLWLEHLRHDGGVTKAKVNALMESLSDVSIKIRLTDDPIGLLTEAGLAPKNQGGEP